MTERAKPFTPPRRSKKRVAASQALADAVEDHARMEWLERLFKQNRNYYDLVAIETLPMEMTVGACNKHHGDAAGRYTAPTLREAIDKARMGRK